VERDAPGIIWRSSVPSLDEERLSIARVELRSAYLRGTDAWVVTDRIGAALVVFSLLSAVELVLWHGVRAQR